MAERLRVVKGGFTYPIGASLARVREAGGISKLASHEREALQLKRVEAGDWCDDMPEESIALRLERGEIERVTAPASRAKAAKDGGE